MPTTNRRTRSATRPIPVELRQPFYLASWDLAWSGHFYRHVPRGANAFLQRFGSGSMIARRHGLTVLWLTSLAGRFNELANLKLHAIDGRCVELQRSKRGAKQTIQVEQELIDCTAAWHRRLVQLGADPSENSYRERKWCEAMNQSSLLLPSVTGKPMNVNVFNRDVAGPVGELFGLRLSSHCFRDTACQEAMRLVRRDASLDVRAVQALMGHRSVRTTEIYLRKQDEQQLCLPLSSFTNE